jgi:hypothetical protein
MTQYYVPKTVVQYAEYPDVNVSWTNNIKDDAVIDQPDYNLVDPNTGAGDRNVLTTVKPLQHIPNSGRGAVLDKTFYLKCSNFEFDVAPNNITGVAVELHTQRNGRVVDDTVAFMLNDEVISENRTNLASRTDGHVRNNNTQVYGGDGDTWGMTLTPELFADPTFSLLIRFASNPQYPHRDGMQIYKILVTFFPDQQFIFEDNDVFFAAEDNIDSIFVPE